MTTIETECCIVGGGPAGIVAGYLFARAGVKTVVLEKHGDFLRDFRGDTVHPSTLEIMHELGLAEALLKRPHQKLRRLAGVFGGKRYQIADLDGLPTRYDFIAFMPQWEFLDFLSDEARRLPAFSLRMNSEVVDLIEENGRIAGVRAVTPEGPLEVRARLTIGADGRHSTARAKSGLRVTDIGAPIDVFWFRVARDPAPVSVEDSLLYVGKSQIVVTIDRGDYWQCAYVIPKNSAEKVRAAGLDAFKATAAATAPHLAAHIGEVASWDDVKLLTVAIDRLEKWSRPGFVCIGDSAHAMSPIGGVGVNLAVQDAVAAANLLAARLATGILGDADLDSVRERRLFPTRVTQFLQVQAQKFVLEPIVSGKLSAQKPPLAMRIIARVPWLQRKVALLFGLGVRPEHVRSPTARD